MAAQLQPRDHPEAQYLDLLRRLLAHGERRGDRTGVGTLSLFGETMRFDLADGFPVLTTKRIFWKAAFKELLWFLSGESNIRPLLRQGVRIWTDWPLARYREATGETITQEEFERRIIEDAAFAEAWGDLGPVYGKQWRDWVGPDGRHHDQIAALVDGLRAAPESRRLLFTAWNVGELDRMALPPCHMTYQFYVAGGRLSGLLYQRSADTFLGLGWNICEAALLIHLLAQQCDLAPGELVWMGGDVHLYLNHVEQARAQVARTPRPLPRLMVRRRPASIFEYRFADLDVEGYEPHAHIPAEVAV